jgi:hypothetical protein
MMTRRFELDDYDMVYDWWIAHQSYPVPLECLPEYGLVVHSEEAPILAGFVYFDLSTPVCFCAHLISAPGLAWAVTTRASEEILKEAKHYAYRHGYRVMTMYAPKAIARYAERNMHFIADERELTNLSIVLTQEVLCR